MSLPGMGLLQSLMPLLNIFGLIDAFPKAEQAQQDFEEANAEREQEIRGGYASLQNNLNSLSQLGFDRQNDYLRSLGRTLNRSIDSNAASAQQGFDSLQGGFNQGFGALQEAMSSGFSDRTNRVLSDLEGLGSAERNAINERYDQQSAMNQADLQSRGLGTSTLLGQARQGAERERGRETSFLNERLQNQRLNLTSDLLGDELSAQERLERARLATDLGISTEALNSQLGFDQQAFQVQSGIGEQINALLGNQFANEMNFMSAIEPQRLAFIERINDLPPNNQNFYGNLSSSGQNLAPNPSGPSDAEIWGPAVIGLALAPFTGGLSLGLAGAGPAMGFGRGPTPCVDADAAITMADGRTKKLRDIQPGDMVEGPRHGKVLDVSITPASEVQDKRFVKIAMKFGGGALIVTADHLMSGKTPEQWAHDDPMFFELSETEPIDCGDLLFEGGGTYIANSFAVDSMMKPAEV